jgi:hypothetical protein
VLGAKGYMDEIDKLTIKQAFFIGGACGQTAFSLGLSKDDANDLQSMEHPFWRKLKYLFIETCDSLSMERQSLRANLDPRVEVDRSKPIPFLEEGEEYVFPEFQETGPDEPDMNTLVKWVHPSQNIIGEKVHGQALLDHLKSSGDIRYCLGLRELEAMRIRGAEFFRYYFRQDENYFAWKSVKRICNGPLVVPYYWVRGENVYRRARHLLHGKWENSDIALMAPKPF